MGVAFQSTQAILHISLSDSQNPLVCSHYVPRRVIFWDFNIVIIRVHHDSLRNTLLDK